MKKLIKHIRKVELDPKKRYLLLLDEKFFTHEQCLEIAQGLGVHGFRSLVAAVSSLDGIKIIEEEINENS